MDYDEAQAFIRDALRHYGCRAQIRQTIEEARELDDALIVWLRHPTDEAQTAVVDEIADALIMVNQMREFFGVEEVDARIVFKINRQRARMEAGQ